MDKFLYEQVDDRFTVGDVIIGGPKLVVMAGPCSVEEESVMLEIARKLQAMGVGMFRAGAFKPRTSPYSFQGTGEAGLKLLAKVREDIGMPIITEVMDPRDVALVSSYADVLQIGTRNMQNYDLLKEVGKQQKPVMLKRGFSATLQEFLMSAEYILKEGNRKVILCERGIRTFVQYTRNTLDLNIVPMLQQKTRLPIIVDPSHGTGVRYLVTPMALAGIAAGGDGLMIETHIDPDAATSDKEQTIRLEQMQDLMSKARKVAQAVQRDL